MSLYTIVVYIEVNGIHRNTTLLNTMKRMIRGKDKFVTLYVVNKQLDTVRVSGLKILCLTTMHANDVLNS